MNKNKVINSIAAIFLGVAVLRAEDGPRLKSGIKLEVLSRIRRVQSALQSGQVKVPQTKEEIAEEISLVAYEAKKSLRQAGDLAGKSHKVLAMCTPVELKLDKICPSKFALDSAAKEKGGLLGQTDSAMDQAKKHMQKLYWLLHDYEKLAPGELVAPYTSSELLKIKDDFLLDYSMLHLERYGDSEAMLATNEYSDSREADEVFVSDRAKKLSSVINILAKSNWTRFVAAHKQVEELKKINAQQNGRSQDNIFRINPAEKL